METLRPMEPGNRNFILHEPLIFTDKHLAPFTYDIEAKVSSSYDDHVPSKIYNFKLEIDPRSNKAVIEKLIDIDNQHSDGKHYRGVQHVVYTRGLELKDGNRVPTKLEFFTYWIYPNGTDDMSNRVTFSGDTKRSACLLERDHTVRVRITFNVVEQSALIIN
jgi:hypothetical protein